MTALTSRLANRSKDYILFNPLLEERWLRAARGRITALLYHRIDAPERFPFLARGGSPVTTPTEFGADLALLTRLGARFFTFADIGEGRFPERDEFGVALCFDDCFADNYGTALELLAAHGVRATLFQSTAMVDADVLLWEHRLYWHTRDDAKAAAFQALALRILPREMNVAGLSSRGMVDWLREDAPWDRCLAVLDAADAELGDATQMRELAAALYPKAEQLRAAQVQGHEIGGHGHRHAKRTTIDAALFEQELAQSKARLTAVLGQPPVSFSYPFDSHFPADAETCRRYFRQAATVAKRRINRDSDRMWLPRFTWPGPARNSFRRRRWLLTGTI